MPAPGHGTGSSGPNQARSVNEEADELEERVAAIEARLDMMDGGDAPASTPGFHTITVSDETASAAVEFFAMSGVRAEYTPLGMLVTALLAIGAPEADDPGEGR